MTKAGITTASVKDHSKSFFPEAIQIAASVNQMKNRKRKQPIAQNGLDPGLVPPDLPPPLLDPLPPPQAPCCYCRCQIRHLRRPMSAPACLHRWIHCRPRPTAVDVAFARSVTGGGPRTPPRVHATRSATVVVVANPICHRRWPVRAPARPRRWIRRRHPRPAVGSPSSLGAAPKPLPGSGLTAALPSRRGRSATVPRGGRSAATPKGLEEGGAPLCG